MSALPLPPSPPVCSTPTEVFAHAETPRYGLQLETAVYGTAASPNVSETLVNFAALTNAQAVALLVSLGCRPDLHEILQHNGVEIDGEFLKRIDNPSILQELEHDMSDIRKVELQSVLEKLQELVLKLVRNASGGASLCERHNKEIEFYCLTCEDDAINCLLCVECGLFDSHKNHNLLPLNQAKTRRARDKLQEEVLHYFSARSCILLQRDQQAATVQAKVVERKEALRTEINQKMNQVAEAAERKRQELLSMVDTMTELKQLQLQRQRQLLQQQYTLDNGVLTQVETELAGEQAAAEVSAVYRLYSTHIAQAKEAKQFVEGAWCPATVAEASVSAVDQILETLTAVTITTDSIAANCQVTRPNTTVTYDSPAVGQISGELVVSARKGQIVLGGDNIITVFLLPMANNNGSIYHNNHTIMVPVELQCRSDLRAADNSYVVTFTVDRSQVEGQTRLLQVCLNYESINGTLEVYFKSASQEQKIEQMCLLLPRALTNIISRLMNNDPALTKLDLPYDRIGEAGAVALAEALKVNRTLAELNLYNNYVGDGGAVAIAEALKVNSTLAELNLSANAIGDAGAVAIAEALKVNRTLTLLNLSVDGIGEAGAVAIAEALKVNRTLTELYMSNNAIGDGGAVAIAEALKVNSTLTMLNLFFNLIVESKKAVLRGVVKGRRNIKVHV